MRSIVLLTLLPASPEARKTGPIKHAKWPHHSQHQWSHFIRRPSSPFSFDIQLIPFSQTSKWFFFSCQFLPIPEWSRLPWYSSDPIFPNTNVIPCSLCSPSTQVYIFFPGNQVYLPLIPYIYMFPWYPTCICSPDPTCIYMFPWYTTCIYMFPWYATCICSPDMLHVYVPLVPHMHMFPWYPTCICSPDTLHVYVPLIPYMYMLPWYHICICSPDIYMHMFPWYPTCICSPDNTLHAYMFLRHLIIG